MASKKIVYFVFLPLLIGYFSCGVIRAGGEGPIAKECANDIRNKDFVPMALLLAFQKKLEKCGYVSECISELIWGFGQGMFSAFLEQHMSSWHSAQSEGSMRLTGGLSFYYVNSDMSMLERITALTPLFLLKKTAFDGGKILMTSVLQNLQTEGA